MLDLNLTNMAVLVNLIFHTSGHNWWPKFEFCMGSFFLNVYFWYEDPFKNLLVLTILFAIWGQNTGFCGHAAICEKMNWQNCWTLSFWRISSLLRYHIHIRDKFYLPRNVISRKKKHSSGKSPKYKHNYFQ